MENVKDDDFTKFQPYMMEKSLQQTRMSFKVRCQMVETIKGNFKAKYKAGGDEKLKCGYCDKGELETQLQWMNLKTNLELNKIEDLAKYFTQLLIARGKEDDKSRRKNMA